MSGTDVDFLQKWISRRDADAFEELVTRHAGMVYSACKRILGNKGDAEGAVQESFLKLARQRSSIACPAAWLYRVAVRTSLDWLRKESRQRERETRYAQCTLSSVEDDADWNTITQAVEESLEALPDSVRAPIVLRFLEGRTHEDIARELGISRQAVQKRIDKGLEELRRSLLRRGIDAPLAVLPGIFATKLVTEPAPPALVASLGKQTLATMTAVPAVGAGGILSWLLAVLLTKGGIATLAAVGLCGAAALLAGSQAWEHVKGKSRVETASSQVVAAQPTAVKKEPVADNATSNTSPGELMLAESTAKAPGTSPDSSAGETDEATSEQEISVSGLVSDEAALSVVNAHVWGETVLNDEKPQVAFDTKTGADGTYAASHIRVTVPSTLNVYVEAAQFAHGKRDFAIARETTALVSDFTLVRAPYFVKGMVVDSRHNPLPGAAVSLVRVSQESSVVTQPDGSPRNMIMAQGFSQHTLFSWTDEAGRFEFWLANEGTCDFSVEKEGFAQGLFTDVPAGTEDACFVLAAPGTVTGHVVRADGTPAQKYIVTVLSEGEYKPDAENVFPRLVTKPDKVAVTDAKGAYTLSELSPQMVYDLGVFDGATDGFQERWGEVMLKPLMCRQGIHVEDGQMLENIDFQLIEDPYARITGHVRNEGTNDPAVGLAVHASQESPYRYMASTRVGEDGAYELEFTLDKTTEVTVGGGYLCDIGCVEAFVHRAEGGQVPGPISVSPGDELTVDLVVAAPFTIPVRVTDEAGNPVSGKAVSLGTIDNGGHWDYERGTPKATDSDGCCVFKGLPPGYTFFVWAQEPGVSGSSGEAFVALTRQGPIRVRSGETAPEVVLVITDRGGVEGVLTDREGLPIANAPVEIVAPAQGGSAEQNVHAETDAEGKFTVVYAFRTGTYAGITLSAKSGDATLKGQLGSVDVPADGIVDLGTIVLLPQ